MNILIVEDDTAIREGVAEVDEDLKAVVAGTTVMNMCRRRWNMAQQYWLWMTAM